MNTIEDRLRDAYRAAAETVTPESIRPLDERVHVISPPRGRRGRGGRRFTPLAAAAAVAFIAVLTTVIIPRIIAGEHPARNGHRAASPAGRFGVTLTARSPWLPAGGRSITIVDAISGATVATIPAPRAGGYFSAVATGDGRHYVAALRRPHSCRTWLYQFSLNGAGQPSALTPYRLASTRQLLTAIAVSRDNGTLAYLGRGCAGTGRAALGVLNLRTMQAKRWAVPGNAIGSLSLTADGRMLSYDDTHSERLGSAAYVLPTNAPPGPADARARVVASAGQFGRADGIESSVITPDGRAVYFTTDHFGALAYGSRWQLRVADLRTGRTHVVARSRGFAAALQTDPAVRKALVAIEQSGPTPSPVPSSPPSATPSASPSGPGLATSSPSPSRPGLATPSPSPSRPGSATPSASPSRPGPASPTPSASPSSPGSPSSSPSPSQAPPIRVRLVLINLRTGSLSPASWSWNPATTIFSW